MGFAAVVVAAGSGERLGLGVPKALMEVDGATLVAHAVTRLVRAGAGAIVVVGPPGALDEVAASLPAVDVEVGVVAGGAERADSVRAGLSALPPQPRTVAVHDAARAFAPAGLIRRAVDALVDDVLAVAPALPVVDTIKRVDGTTVVDTPDRSSLVGVQTPQVFRRDALVAAHDDSPDASDDLALVEAAIGRGDLSGRVRVIDGDPLAMKVTWPVDLTVLAALLEEHT